MFNALTKNNVLAANYPFATIDPNVGVVPLPDERLARLAEIFGSEKILPATVSFVDIAGIVRGASEGEGLGNKFLANIREADAICQVVRAFEDGDVVHVDGKVSPSSDIETIHTELILADLQTLEKARHAAREGGADQEGVQARCSRTPSPPRRCSRRATTLYAAGAAAGVDLALASGLGLLTTKPFIYVFNLDEEQLADADLHARLGALVAPADAVFLNAKLEMDLMEMSEEDALEMLQSFGAEESRPRPARAGRLPHPRPADLPHRRAQGVAGLDHPPGLDRTAGGGRHPHRLPARLHQGRDRLVHRPGCRGLDGRCPGGRAGAHGGQGVRDAGRRRRGVPLQRLNRRVSAGQMGCDSSQSAHSPQEFQRDRLDLAVLRAVSRPAAAM